jgi:hypothetical protein
MKFHFAFVTIFFLISYTCWADPQFGVWKTILPLKPIVSMNDQNVNPNTQDFVVGQKIKFVFNLSEDQREQIKTLQNVRVTVGGERDRQKKSKLPVDQKKEI